MNYNDYNNNKMEVIENNLLTVSSIDSSSISTSDVINNQLVLMNDISQLTNPGSEEIQSMVTLTMHSKVSF